jgi:uncharacterized protein (TIGR03084 family)
LDPILTALADQMAELAGLLDPLDEAGWQAPTPCPGWTVSDVVLHLAQTDEMAVASLGGRFAEVVAELTAGAPAADVDEGAGLMVARQRGAPGPEVRDRWQHSVDVLLAEFGVSDPHDRVPWVAGELSVATLATTRLAETWVHTTDVAAALGVELAPTDRLWHVARLAWRTLPYAFARAGRALSGPVTFVLRAPSGDTWTFESDDADEAEVLTTVEGTAADLCLVAGQRRDAADTGLRGDGPDAAGVLALVRTFA